MLVGYARVSTADQSLGKYIDMLLAAGVDSRMIYSEKISGKKEHRPELERMINGLKAEDVVIIPDISRLSRSVRDLFQIIDRIRACGSDIRSLKENWLDTTDPRNKLLFTMLAALAEFEADLISERTKEGIAAARARGRHGGRPSIQNKKAQMVCLMYDNGMKIADIVQQAKISRSTVYRILNNYSKLNWGL